MGPLDDVALLTRWDALMRAVERPYALAILREKNRYVGAAAEAFEAQRRLDPHQFEQHVAMMLGLAELYQGIAIRIGLAETLKGEKAFAPVLERKDTWDKLWLYLVQLWVREHAAEWAKETAETTRKDLQRVVDASLAADGEFNPVQVAKNMLTVLGLSAFRAMTIAQTETHNAMMFASQRGAEKLARDSGLALKKRWVPVQDERTRVNHAAMASQPAIDLDADFIVGGERMQRPGDPRGSSANTVRCRCVLAYLAISVGLD